MTTPESTLRKAAVWLGTKCGDLLPARQSEWAAAISHEIRHIPSDFEAMRWSLGAVRACLNERMRAMSARVLRVTRWVWIPEMLLCFVPLTWFWVVLAGETLGRSGLIGITWPYLLVAALGPLGLALAIWKTLMPAVPMKQAVLVGLCIATGGVIALQVSGWLPLFGAGGPMADWWRDFVLIAVLPFMGALHLATVAGPEADGASGPVTP
jgi:hypothetical protein